MSLKLGSNKGKINVGATGDKVLYSATDSTNNMFAVYFYMEGGIRRFRIFNLTGFNSGQVLNWNATTSTYAPATQANSGVPFVAVLNAGVTASGIMGIAEPDGQHLPYEGGIAANYFTNLPSNLVEDWTATLVPDSIIGTTATTVVPPPVIPKTVSSTISDWISSNPILAVALFILIVLIIVYIVIPLIRGEEILGGMMSGNNRKQLSRPKSYLR